MQGHQSLDTVVRHSSERHHTVVEQHDHHPDYRLRQLPIQGRWRQRVLLDDRSTVDRMYRSYCRYGNADSDRRHLRVRSDIRDRGDLPRDHWDRSDRPMVKRHIDGVWYAAGQLFCAHGNLLYAPFVSPSTAGPTAIGQPGSGATPSLLYTNPNPAFVWSVLAAGNSYVYVGGRSSTAGANLCEIYRTQIATGAPHAGSGRGRRVTAGETMYAAVPVCQLHPDRDELRSTVVYHPGRRRPGRQRWRPEDRDPSSRTSCSRSRCPCAVSLVTFGSSTSGGQLRPVVTGLGRMDLSTFIDQQAPAYTSDLMVGYDLGP